MNAGYLVVTIEDHRSTTSETEPVNIQSTGVKRQFQIQDDESPAEVAQTFAANVRAVRDQARRQDLRTRWIAATSNMTAERMEAALSILEAPE